MDLQLSGKTALITGASKGIGLETAKVLLDEGVTVITASRTVSAELSASGATILTADLSTPDAPARIVAEALTVTGQLDILVNNVGGNDAGAPGAGFLDFGDDIWFGIFALNLFASIRTTRAALPALLTSRGSVVNVSSDSALRPHTAPLPYSTAKAALNAFTKGLAEEYGPQGVRINTISPAATRTAMWEGETGVGADLARSMGVSQGALIAALPAQMGLLTGRFVEPAEVANTIAYLLSPHAESVHGANWLIDAGGSKFL